VATFVFDRAKGCMVDKVTGKPARLPKKFSPPRIHLALDYKAYDCPVTGKPIEGRRAHQENLKRQGCRVLETGEKEHNMRERAESDRKLERTIEAAVEKTAAELNI
jgi:hypothetical protein